MNEIVSAPAFEVPAALGQEPIPDDPKREIVFADLESKPHLFNFQGFSGLLIFLKLLGALVVILTPIDYLNDRRVGVG